jgi:hypothetical protein
VRSPILATTLSLTLGALGALGACGSVGTQPGDACSTSKPCTSGQICDMTDPEGPACLDGSGDLDGDGIPNDKDFCEHMAGGAHDEDRDGIGDECDACPIAKPPAVAETDGDGVDSPCDPNPTTPGDKIVLFNGFNDPLPGTWTATPGWKVVGGEAVMTPTSSAMLEQLSVPIAGTSHLAIFAAYRFDCVASDATMADAAVIGLDHRPAGDLNVVCGGSRSGGADQLLVTSSAGTNNKPFSNLFNPASLYRVTEQLDGANANCALIADNENGAIQTAASGDAMTAAGLYARGATVRFSYILAVAR